MKKIVIFAFLCTFVPAALYSGPDDDLLTYATRGSIPGTKNPCSERM
jgi:hypothetical protein